MQRGQLLGQYEIGLHCVSRIARLRTAEKIFRRSAPHPCLSCRAPSTCDICGRDTRWRSLQFQRRSAPAFALVVILRRGLLSFDSLPRLPVACTSFSQGTAFPPICASAQNSTSLNSNSPRATRKEVLSQHHASHSSHLAVLSLFLLNTLTGTSPPILQPVNVTCTLRSASTRPSPLAPLFESGGRGPACLLGAPLLAHVFSSCSCRRGCRSTFGLTSSSSATAALTRTRSAQLFEIPGTGHYHRDAR